MVRAFAQRRGLKLRDNLKSVVNIALVAFETERENA